MKGPIRLVRSEAMKEYHNQGAVFTWSEEEAYLIVDRVEFKGKPGAVLCYHNPPVHQVGNLALDAYLEGLNKLLNNDNGLEFLILCGANDPVHAGGDLKESLNRLDETLELKREKQASGASPKEIDRLFNWADSRLKKGFSLYQTIRRLAGQMRVVAVCGGGTRFGGSAEIPLMADYVVGDSRSGICFSEATIGLLPGWAGVGRALSKAGRTNTEYMAKISSEVKADQLQQVGIYSAVVEIAHSFPKRQRTDDPQSDRAAYLEALDNHDMDTGLELLPRALEMAAGPEDRIPVINDKERLQLARSKQISEEVGRRSNPETYSGLWGKPIKAVKEEISRLGRPLAPQSIAALEKLFKSYDPDDYREEEFVEREMWADAALYRDPRFRAGLVAALEQRVADFRMPGE